MSARTHVAYLFSVAKPYFGCFYDYWFADGPRQAIDDPDRSFRNYNTKMHWYEFVP
jgi:hypothetical protein